MRQESSFRGIGSNLGACFAYYLAIVFVGRMYPNHFLHILPGGIVFWVVLPHAELFLRRMTRPIRRARPKKRERVILAAALVRMKPR